MGGAHQLHAALGDGPGRGRLQLGADLVDDDDLGHVILHGLDHHGVLLGGGLDLHPPGAPDPGMGDVAVTPDLVGGVDDDHPLALVVAQHPGALAEHGGLPDAGGSQQKDAAALDHDVLDDVDGPGHRPADAAGEAHDGPGAVADGADAMQGALDPGAVVIAEIADALDHVLDVGVGDRHPVEDDLAVDEARLGLAAEVEHHLEQVPAVGRGRLGGQSHTRREGLEEEGQLLFPGRPVFALRTAGSSARSRGPRLHSSLRHGRQGAGGPGTSLRGSPGD